MARNEWQDIPEGNKIRVRKSLGKHPITGKRKSVSRLFPKNYSKKAVRSWLAQELTDFLKDTGPETEKMKFGQVFRKWVANRERTWQSEETKREYEGHYARYMKPFHSKNIQDITRPQILNLLTGLVNDGLSDTTVNKVYKLLKQIFDYAQNALEVITANPMPEGKYRPKGKPKTEYTILTTEQRRRFLKAAKGDRFEVLYTFLLVTGLRIGEALALEWEDITPEGVKVKQSLQSVTNGFRVGPPKSDSAHRTVPLPESLRALLDAYPRKGKYVFSGRGSNPYQAVQRHMKEALKAAKLPVSTRIHDLRHSACTAMLVDGINPKVVSTLLGHSDVAFTLNRYAHYIPEWGEDVGPRLERLHFSHRIRTEAESAETEKPSQTRAPVAQMDRAGDS